MDWNNLIWLQTIRLYKKIKWNKYAFLDIPDQQQLFMNVEENYLDINFKIA